MARFKSRFTFAAAALLVAMACLRADAAGPAVPLGSVGDDSIVVVHVDVAHFSPDSLKEAAQVVLGANANKADEGIAKFKEKYDQAVAAGIEGATFVIGDEKPAEDGHHKKTKPVVYIQLKEGADVEAVKKMITSDMSATDREHTLFRHDALGILVMYEKDCPPPAAPNKERAAAFAEALATVSDASVQVAFIPTAHVKEQMLKEDAPMKGMKEAAAALANAKWSTLAVKFGHAPGLVATVNAADADGAKHFSDAINLGLDEAKQQLANPKPDNPLAMFGPLISPLIDGLRPATNGTLVTVSIKGESLTNIANFAANMGMLSKKKAVRPPVPPADK